jgi:hypothetical protein
MLSLTEVCNPESAEHALANLIRVVRSTVANHVDA